MRKGLRFCGRSTSPVLISTGCRASHSRPMPGRFCGPLSRGGSSACLPGEPAQAARDEPSAIHEKRERRAEGCEEGRERFQKGERRGGRDDQREQGTPVDTFCHRLTLLLRKRCPVL